MSEGREASKDGDRSGPPAARKGAADAPASPHGTGGQPGESREGDAAGEQGTPDLQVEHWQAPKPDRMKADAREIWEFESENVRPSRAFWYNLFLIIVALAGGLALIAYGLHWLVSAASSPGPPLP